MLVFFGKYITNVPCLCLSESLHYASKWTVPKYVVNIHFASLAILASVQEKMIETFYFHFLCIPSFEHLILVIS